MAGYMETEVDLVVVADQILVYHREAVIDMHTAPRKEDREKLYHKAEAAREMLMLLGKIALNQKEFKAYQRAIQERLEAVYQAVFFDPATRKQIKNAKENNNGDT